MGREKHLSWLPLPFPHDPGEQHKVGGGDGNDMPRNCRVVKTFQITQMQNVTNQRLMDRAFWSIVSPFGTSYYDASDRLAG